MQRNGSHVGEADIQHTAYRLRHLLDVETPKQRLFTCARSSISVESWVFSIVTSQALKSMRKWDLYFKLGYSDCSLFMITGSSVCRQRCQSVDTRQIVPVIQANATVSVSNTDFYCHFWHDFHFTCVLLFLISVIHQGFPKMAWITLNT